MIKTLNSLLSLQPLVVVLKKMIAEGKPGAKKLYEGLIQEIESKPELLKPMADISPLARDAELVETILSLLPPVPIRASTLLHYPSIPKPCMHQQGLKNYF
jgi:hypothetical protein